MEDGQIIVLGGLIQEDLVEAEQKVPGLGDVPLLGWLFRYQRTTKIKTNLMVFIHPTIIKDERTLLSLTGEKYNYLRAKQLKMKEEGLRLMSDSEIPVMEEMHEVMKLPPPYEQSLQRMELSSPSSLPPMHEPANKPIEEPPPVVPAAETQPDKATVDTQPPSAQPADLPPFIGE